MFRNVTTRHNRNRSWLRFLTCNNIEKFRLWNKIEEHLRYQNKIVCPPIALELLLAQCRLSFRLINCSCIQKSALSLRFKLKHAAVAIRHATANAAVVAAAVVAAAATVVAAATAVADATIVAAATAAVAAAVAGPALSLSVSIYI